MWNGVWNTDTKKILLTKAKFAPKQTFFCAAILHQLLVKVFVSGITSFHYYSPRILNLQKIWTSDFRKWGQKTFKRYFKSEQRHRQTDRQAHVWKNRLIESISPEPNIKKKTRQGSPVDRRPSTDEAPPIGKINPFSKMAVTFEPLMRFWCPSGFRKFWITMTSSVL